LRRARLLLTLTLLALMMSSAVMIEHASPASRRLDNSWLAYIAQVCPRNVSYDNRWCTAAHGCPEEATRPTPRSTDSITDAAQCAHWHNAHRRNARSAREFRTTDAGEPSSARTPLVLLGDSITEEMVGTKLGEPAARCDGVPERLSRAFRVSAFATLVLGVSGDSTQHLLWRLQHGEMPPALARNQSDGSQQQREQQQRQDQPPIFSLLIGTNNVAFGHAPPQIIAGVQAIAHLILEQASPHAVLAINALLPRADERLHAIRVNRVAHLCPPRCAPGGGSLESLKPLVGEVNRGLHHLVERLKARYASRRIGFVDCGHVLLSSLRTHAAAHRASGVRGGRSRPGHASDANAAVVESESEAGARGYYDVNASLVPDLLHPNAAGFERLLRCMKPKLLALASAAGPGRGAEH
jgi:lysophospholipase L1-like esterase